MFVVVLGWSGGMHRTSRRFKGLGNGTEYFHCVSRVVDRRMVLKQREKEEFIRIMRLYEGDSIASMVAL